MTTTKAGAVITSRQWWILFAASLGTFMCSLDVHIVNLALPTLVEELHSDFATVAWVPLSYSLMLSLLVLCAARLGDMWSKKWLYLVGLVAFILSSLVCGMASTIEVLIAARIFQGSGAVFIAVLTPAIVTESFPDEKRGLALGIVASTGWVGVSLGPTAGGVLLEYFGWRAGFLVNVPICSICMMLVILLLPQGDRPRESKRFDFLGALLLTVTLTCFLLGTTSTQGENLASGSTLILLLTSVAGCIFFLLSQKFSTDPLINLELFRSLKLSLSLLLSLITYIFVNAVMFMLPFFLELVKHYPKPEIGLLVAVMPVLGVCSAPIAGVLADRFTERSVSTVGVVLLLIGCLAIGTFNEELTVSGYLLRMLPVGIGFGLFQPPNQSAILGSVSSKYVSVASGLWFFSRTLGQVIGITLIEVLFSQLTASYAPSGVTASVTMAPPEALVFGEQVSFRTIAVTLGVSVGISGFLWQRQHQELRVAD
ncbi:MAG: DHA2 family efflux MFS transporter permease subunit [Hormoscilla sp.]